MKNFLNVPIILASGSPRRIDLLNQAGIYCEVMPPEIEEKRKKGESPVQYVKRTSKEKAEAVMMSAIWEYGGAVIIAADTDVVAPDGKTILGKPKDEADARRMIKKLSGKTHTVLTGYTILSVAREQKAERITRAVRTKVKMRVLNKESIEKYIAAGESMDKAGAYAAQGVGMNLVESLSGSYTNVVGLPMAQLLGDLESKFGVPFLHAFSDKR